VAERTGVYISQLLPGVTVYWHARDVIWTLGEIPPIFAVNKLKIWTSRSATKRRSLLQQAPVTNRSSGADITSATVGFVGRGY